MKQLMKKGVSLLLVLMLLISLLPGVCLVADAASVTYVYSGSYIYNWGVREEEATFLSPKAEAFYKKYNVTYEELAELSGSSNNSSVPSSALYQKLYTLMKNAQTKVTSYDDTRSLYQYTDCQGSGQLNGGKISSFYSGALIGPAWDKGDTWNREHTWPNSKGGSGSNENDIMMLRPTSKSENSSRGNEAYGEGSSYYNPNSASGGKYDVRGDVARIMLFVYVRWGGDYSVLHSNMWGSSGVIQSKEILLKWMEQDPVDTWELGRNDSVEAITGTRNVFVDYPELAFELFEEEVPVMQTPSGTASSAFKITAVSSNTAHGTVSVNGTQIVATPAAGYKVSGYTLLSGTATVTQNGNVFQVTPSSSCQIRVDFAKLASTNLTFVENSGTATGMTAYVGQAMTMPEHTEDLPEGYTFRGWVTAQVKDSTQKPGTVYAAGSSYTPTGAQTFYALYSWVEGEGTGEPEAKLITSNSSLSAGMTVIIAAANYDFAVSTEANTNNRRQTAITKVGNTLEYGDDVQLFTLEEGTVSGTFAFKLANGYLYASSNTTGSNHLKIKAEKDDNGSFKITVSPDGSCTAIAQGTNKICYMAYNVSGMFSCYASNHTQKPIALYAVSKSGTLHYTTAQDVSFQITEQPEDVTAEEGSTTYFTVEVIGEGLTYQWQYREKETYAWKASPATGNKTATLTVPATTGRNGYQYRCVVTNAMGTVLYSNVATLKVTASTAAFAITQQPVDSTVVEGVDSYFTVTATGSGLTYQWQYREGASYGWKTSPANGNKTATLIIPGATWRSGYQYRCVITNGSGQQLTSNTVTLTVTKNWDAALNSWSLTLGDDIGVNFKLSMTAAEAAGAVVSLTVGDETKEVKLADATADADGNYIVSADVAAAQMTDDVYVVINGYQLKEQYSVRKYAEYILADEESDEATKALVAQLLHYGAAAQKFFDYNDDNLANEEYQDTAENAVPAAGQDALVSGQADGIKFYAGSMVYRSRNAVRYYFEITGDVNDYTFETANGTYEAELKDGLYFVEIADIAPDALDENITLTVTDADGDALVVTYGPMSYITRQYQKTQNAELKALLQQLYDYYLAAEAFVAK